MKFDYNPGIFNNPPGDGPAPFFFPGWGSAAIFTVSWDGVVVDEIDNILSGTEQWNTYTVNNLKATSNFTNLSITMLKNGFSGLDNVDVELAPAATPIPAALPLFATGLGGFGLLSWRRKRKAQAVAG